VLMLYIIPLCDYQILLLTLCVGVCQRLRLVVPKVCATDLKGSVISFQGIHGYISVMAILKFTIFFKLKEHFVKNNCVIYLIGNVFILYDW